MIRLQAKAPSTFNSTKKRIMSIRRSLNEGQDDVAALINSVAPHLGGVGEVWRDYAELL